MPIRDISVFADLCRAGDGTKAQHLGMLCAHRKRVLAEFAQAEEHLKAIEFKIDYYERELSPEARGSQPEEKA